MAGMGQESIAVISTAGSGFSVYFVNCLNLGVVEFFNLFLLEIAL